MSLKAKVAAVCVTGVVLAGTTVLTVVPASASPVSPRGCAPEYDYSFASKLQILSHGADFITYGKGGSTLSESIAKGDSWSGTLTGTVGTEAGVIFAKATVSVSASLQKSRTSTITRGGSWTIPSSRASGWVAMGAGGYRFTWKYGHYSATCAYVLDRSGVGQYPLNGSIYFDHS